MIDHIVLHFPARGVRVRAKLLLDQAPATCERIARLLPVRGRSFHDIWSGRMISLPLASRIEIEPENVTFHVVPGDLGYYERGPHLDRGRPYGYLEMSEITVAYGRDAQPSGPRGPKMVNLFASIEEGLGSFADACEHMIQDGSQEMEILPG